MRPCCSITSLVSFAVASGFSQEVTFTRVATEEKPSFDFVSGFTQDAKGYRWFCGYGLYRYDGNTTTTYRHDPLNANSLSGNRVNYIYRDKEGMIWAGTFEKELDRLDPETSVFPHFHHNRDDKQSLKNVSVTALLEDCEGASSVGTLGGIASYTPVTGAFMAGFNAISWKYYQHLLSIKSLFNKVMFIMFYQLYLTNFHESLF